MGRKVIINVEEKAIRAAELEDGKLVELYMEREEEPSLVGNIYKGQVMDVVPALEALFVDLGLERNCFLHFNDLRQEFFRSRPQGKATTKDKRLKLQPGDPVLVQVIRDETKDKPPRVTTFISLAGHYLVLLPHSPQAGGTSRRIRNLRERRRLQRIRHIASPSGMGVILRTLSAFHTRGEIEEEVRSQLNLWERIQKDFQGESAPTLLYQEPGLIFWLVRETFELDLKEIVIDSQEQAEELRALLAETIPGLDEKVTWYCQPDNTFDAYGIEAEIRKATQRRVWLKSGGFLLIEELETLTAIDVNSGRFTGGKKLDETFLHINLEACVEIARQLRLRNIGGIIVVDFITMRPQEHRRQLMRCFREQMRRDRAKYYISPRLTEFGLLQMTRQRQRRSLRQLLFEPCDYCHGAGFVLSLEESWRLLKYQLIRELQVKGTAEPLEISLHPRLFEFIERDRGHELAELQAQSSVKLKWIRDASLLPAKFSLKRGEQKIQEGSG